MGMSASQARLLSITARLTDNEMSSQLITNSKLRLADKSSEASSEYMKALNANQLMYYSYDDEGKRSTQSLTAGALINYAELKNQYALVNTSGQIMVSSIDKANYEKSKTLTEFLACYDVPLTDNPKYAEALEDIYGDDAETLHNDDNVYQWNDYLNNLTDDNIKEMDKLLAKDAKDFTEQDFNTIKGYVTNWQSSVTTVSGGVLSKYTGLDGVFGDYVNKLMNSPTLGYPDINDPTFTDITGDSELAKKFELASYKCYQSAKGGDSGCFLHVLAHLMDLKLSDLNASGRVDSSWVRDKTTTTGKSIHVTSSNVNGSFINGDGMSDDMAEVSEYIWDPNKNCMAPADPNDKTTENSSEAEKLLSNYKFVNGEKQLKTFPERIIDLYYAVQNRTSLGVNYDTLLSKLDSFQNDMANTLTTEFNEDRYLESVNKTKLALSDWLTEVKGMKQGYKEVLDNLPVKEIPDENDPKYEWYKNLWYRMGGISETKKSDNANNYKELDSEKMNNAEWLQFALEQGILTLEQVNFSEDGSDEYPNIGLRDWVSIQYNNSSDITTQQDSVAITKAEVKYKNAISDIEQQDKKYDQDLKKLDSLHSALQTEYDSVKSVIEKNVERSFKAFS